MIDGNHLMCFQSFFGLVVSGIMHSTAFLLAFLFKVYKCFCRAAIKCRHDLAMIIPSVRLTVKRVDCDKTE